MTACEKCWSDAYRKSLGSGRDQVYWYHKLLRERQDGPCSPKEQAGQWWNEELQCDERLLHPGSQKEDKFKYIVTWESDIFGNGQHECIGEHEANLIIEAIELTAGRAELTSIEVNPPDQINSN